MFKVFIRERSEEKCITQKITTIMFCFMFSIIFAKKNCYEFKKKKSDNLVKQTF